MSQSLTEVAQQLKDANKKMQLIYAFNGGGKTRLSREFKNLVEADSGDDENNDGAEHSELSQKHILYYSAFTEDLFYWDNDLIGDEERKLKIHPNSFTDWVLKEQGQDQNIIANFQYYTDEKLTPHFNEGFSEVTFSFERGNEEHSQNIKISKGEESNFVWSVFSSLLDQVIETLNVAEPSDRENEQFNQLEYVFIDDPVSSLDENHLIELAVNLAQLIKSSDSETLKFIVTTHNPLFYNVLHNELNRAPKYVLKKLDDGAYDLITQPNDSPFSYHLQLKAELEKAVNTGQLHKYHFNFLRNILEKTSTFVGYEQWGNLLPEVEDGRESPYARIINIHSHSKYASEEVVEVTDEHRRVLGFLVHKLDEMYRLKMSAE